MSKRSNTFERNPRDYYPTPFEAILPLQGYLRQGFTFCEPCVGDGRLVDHLEKWFDADCLFACDIEPQVKWAVTKDAKDLNSEEVEYCDVIITNPPFKWEVLAPLMTKWISLKPTILLLPADFMHNVRFAPFLAHCEDIISVGRIKWIEGSKNVGTDNYAWYCFTPKGTLHTNFIGRKFT